LTAEGENCDTQADKTEAADHFCGRPCVQEDQAAGAPPGNMISAAAAGTALETTATSSAGGAAAAPVTAQAGFPAGIHHLAEHLLDQCIGPLVARALQLVNQQQQQQQPQEVR
jgi:hypothetical protein